MAHWQLTELVSTVLPARHELIHQGYEVSVVRRLQQMRHFVDDDVFEVLSGFLRKLGVEAYRACTGIAAPPFGLHLLHIELLNRDPYYGFPPC